MATAPRQLWCWDMTYLPAEIGGRWFYLYLILDAFSRKIVGFEVHDTDDSVHADETGQAHGARRRHSRNGEIKPVLHGDNGSTFKATTVLAMLHRLRIKPSYSRPRVSDDNAFVESLFRTAKYRPEFPAKGFADLEAARAMGQPVRALVQRRASAQRHPLRQPADRHDWHDEQILQRRHALSAEA